MSQAIDEEVDVQIFATEGSDIGFTDNSSSDEEANSSGEQEDDAEMEVEHDAHWEEVQRPLLQPIPNFTVPVGVLHHLDETASPLDFMALMITDNIWETMVTETNR